ncbi:MAG TPA: DUF2000 domain-containing protein [Pseudonocardiaceae bacterium]|jgi:hypothetical protein|nr:DUF2000 domain-containing protein [Pseudonocardiaceae bacterium]
MTSVGFVPEEIDTSAPTRAARLKWVVVVNDALPPGIAVNAAVCVAAATGRAVPGLLGPDGTDAGGAIHPGLPWAGCTILGAGTERLRELRAKASGSPDVFVVDMPDLAQQVRVYDEYLQGLREAAQALEYYAVGMVGPRNRIDKLVKKLPLL